MDISNALHFTGCLRGTHPASLGGPSLPPMSAADVDFPSDLRSLEREYELIRELGQGGMAAVYLARHRATGRLVAIKAIRARYLDDPDAVRRFAREAETVADLHHPNIVRTEAIEQFGDRAVAIIMEHVPGGTVRDRLREFGSLGAEEVEAILRDVASALAYAHQRGIVHRDVKPENVFLDSSRRRAVLSDFGIARPIQTDIDITLLGAALGTPQYMSPEQIDGALVDGRSDIYSLGVLGWELLTGRRPWAGESLYGVIYKQKHEDLPRITSLRPRVPANLLFAIEGALVKDRERRWQTIDEFLNQLTYNPPPLLSQKYPAGVAPSEYEPTVQFLRAGLQPLDEATTMSPDLHAGDSDGTPDAPTLTDQLASASPPLVLAGGSPGPSDATPASGVAQTNPPVDWAVSPSAAVPNASSPFHFPTGRRRALQVAGLVVPIGIAAASFFVLLSGSNKQTTSDAEAPRVTSSAGSVVGDSGVAAGVASQTAPVADTSPSPPPAEPKRQVPASNSRVTSRSPIREPRRTAGIRAGGSTTVSRGAAASPSGVLETEGSPVTHVSDPVDVAVRRSDGESSPSPPPIDDPFKIPPRRPPVTLGSSALPSSRCRLAATADQQACLSAYIVRGDAPLDRAFDSLVSELRRVARTPAGAADPPTVRRVRLEQRAWLSIRNTECPRTPLASAGPFWAEARSQCFAEMAKSRAAELQAAVKRLRRK